MLITSAGTKSQKNRKWVNDPYHIAKFNHKHMINDKTDLQHSIYLLPPPIGNSINVLASFAMTYGHLAYVVYLTLPRVACYQSVIFYGNIFVIGKFKAKGNLFLDFQP